MSEYFEDGDLLHQEYTFKQLNDSTMEQVTRAKSQANSPLKVISTTKLIITENGIKCHAQDTSLHLICYTKGKSIYFDYDYKLHGKHLKMRDAWIYMNDSTFTMMIGQRQNDEFTKLFMETKLIRK